jgi:hypothetical protein
MHSHSLRRTLLMAFAMATTLLFCASTWAAPPATNPSSPASQSGQPSSRPTKPSHIPPAVRERHQKGDDEGASTALLNGYITYKGGWTQTSPHIYILFWGDWSSAGDPYNVQNYLWRFYSGVGGSAWNDLNTQYGYGCGAGAIGCASGVRNQNPTGQLRNYAYDSSYVPVNPTFADVAAEAAKAKRYFKDASVNAQYVIATPTGHRDQYSINNSFCAWHNYTWVDNSPISFTSMPYLPDLGRTCGANQVNAGSAGVLDGVSILAGHEYVESATDPFLDAWSDSAKAENADKCLQWTLGGYFRNVTFSTGTFAVEPNWSNYHYQQFGNGCYFA